MMSKSGSVFIDESCVQISANRILHDPKEMSHKVMLSMTEYDTNNKLKHMTTVGLTSVELDELLKVLQSFS